jgi:hypothetical protein
MRSVGELMREAGLDSYVKDGDLAHQMAISRFAALVVGEEREACVKACETAGNEWVERSPRMQHHTGAGIGALKCADLIRARGNQ